MATVDDQPTTSTATATTSADNVSRFCAEEATRKAKKANGGKEHVPAVNHAGMCKTPIIIWKIDGRLMYM
jgi:hypothetical protein